MFFFTSNKNFSPYLSSELVQHFGWNLFESSKLVSFFHSAKIVFRQQLHCKAIQYENSQYQKTKSEMETG